MQPTLVMQEVAVRTRRSTEERLNRRVATASRSLSMLQQIFQMLTQIRDPLVHLAKGVTELAPVESAATADSSPIVSDAKPLSAQLAGQEDKPLAQLPGQEEDAEVPGQ